MIGGLGIAIHPFYETPSTDHSSFKNTYTFALYISTIYMFKRVFVKLNKHEVTTPETGCSAIFGRNQSTCVMPLA